MLINCLADALRKMKFISLKSTIECRQLQISAMNTLNLSLIAGFDLVQMKSPISVVVASQNMSLTHAIRLSLMTTQSPCSKCKTDRACMTSWRVNPFPTSSSKELTEQISPTNCGLATLSHGPSNVNLMEGHRKRRSPSSMVLQTNIQPKLSRIKRHLRHTPGASLFLE